MKRYLLLVALFALSLFQSYGQCDPVISLSPTICSDPDNGIYFINPTDEVTISIEDQSGNPQSVNWVPKDFLYMQQGQLGGLKEINIPGFLFPSPVYLNGNPHNNPSLNSNPIEGMAANAVYTYAAEFTIGDPSCGPTTENITIVTGGFTYNDYCKNDVKTITDIENDLTILSNYPTITWYADTSALNAVPDTTTINPGDTYYVDLDIAGCSTLIPVYVEYTMPLPEGASVQEFCSETTWINAGYTGKDGDTLADLIVCGENLTWYSDAAGTIVLPSFTELVDGTTYYVSQGEFGCESGLLAITVVERECSCTKNAGFEKDTVSLSDFEFFYDANIGLKHCDMSSITNTTPITLGPVNGWTGANLVDMNTEPFDSHLSQYGIILPTSNPYTDNCSRYSLRLNDTSVGGYVAKMRSEFIAGDVLAFDFALVLENPTGHLTDQPFMNVRVFDEFGNLVQERCIVSDPEGCVFFDVSEQNGPNDQDPSQTVLYSEWSSVKMNTAAIQGKKAVLEVSIADCGASAHYGYGYIDNLYVGPELGSPQDSTFGYATLEPVADNGDGYADCSLVQPPTENPACEPELAILNPQFPLQVCGTYVEPVVVGSAPEFGDITLYIYNQNGQEVGKILNFTGTGGQICFTVNASDITGDLYGEFTFELEVAFDIPCGQGSGFDEIVVTALSSGIKMCPTSGCPAPISFCSVAGGPQPINLRNSEVDVLDGLPASDYKITYYTDENDAHAGSGTSQITGTQVTNYTVTSSETIYIRLEYDYAALGISAIDDCYDVVPLEILVGDYPQIPATVAGLTECGSAGVASDFNLEDSYTDIFAGLNADSYTTEFYTSHTAADTQDVSQQITNYTAYPSVGTETVYVRVMNEDGCHAVTEFTLTIDEIVYSTPLPVTECEGATQGIATFDLTQITNQITGGNLNLGVTYYYSQAGADSQTATDEVPQPYNAYQNSTQNAETLFARIEESTSAGCSVVESVQLNVAPRPVVNTIPAQFSCDNDNSGSETFILSSFDSAITGGASGVSVSYHADMNAANSGTPALPNSYSAPVGTTTIFARVTDSTPQSCFNVVSIDIEVGESPNLPTNIPALASCDAAGGGVFFNLTDRESDILANETGLIGTGAVSYYEDAGLTMLISDTDALNYSSTGQIIYVEVEGVNGCVSSTSFNLIVDTVSVGAITDKSECDGGGSGFAVFDLTDSDAEALNGQSPTTYSVYYFQEADSALAQTGDITASINNDATLDETAYTNATNPEQIWVVVKHNSYPDCYVVTSYEISATASAAFNEPVALEECDDDNDGFVNFDLTSAETQIQGGNTTIAVSVHPTPSDAQNNVNELPANYTNVNAYNQILYLRIVDTQNGCESYRDLPLIVYDSPAPIITAPTDVSGCDDDSDGFAYVDFMQVANEVLSGLDPATHTVTFHADSSTATAGTPEITPAGNHQTAEIWVRVTNQHGCFGITSFQYTVNPLPVPIQATPLEVCDDMAGGSDTDEIALFDLTSKELEISGGNTSWNFTWYNTDDPTQLNNATLIQNPASFQNDIAGHQTVIAQVTDENGCEVTTTLTLTVNPLPSPEASIPNYVVCDDDNDGFVEFDLSTQSAFIANGEPGISITYYTTAIDAEAGLAQNEIGPLYQNTVAFTQEIFARATNDVTGCHRVVSFMLEVTGLPEVDFSAATDMYACDVDNIGSARFDIRENEAAILGNANPSDFTITYHESESDALVPQNAIGSNNLSNYQVTTANSPTTIWMRISYTATGCERILSFDLIVNEAPSISHPSMLSACDSSAQAIDDEIGLFDLTERTPAITNGDNSLAVYYYEPGSDPMSDSPIINDMAYENPSGMNPVTIPVKVVSPSGCELLTTLTLTVTPNPSIADPLAPIEVCDADNDGVEEFPLGDLIPTILNGEPNVSISFHLTAADAESGTSPIDTSAPYQTSVGNTQVLHVRAENVGPNGTDGTGCYVTRTLTLVTVASPEVVALEDLYQCEDESLLPGYAVFDLTENHVNILGNQNADSVTITYHENAADAATGDNAIAVPMYYTNTAPYTPQEIWVHIENETTGCYDVEEHSFFIYVEELPEVTSPSPLRVCDDDYDNVPMANVSFDLTQKEGEMAGVPGMPAPANYSFTYYANLTDYQNGTAISDPRDYTNETQPQTVYIEVENTSTQEGCSRLITMTLEVLALPSPSEEDFETLAQEQCDDDNDGIASTPFDLTTSGLQIAGGENVEMSYWKTQTAAEEGDTSVVEYIATPSAYTNELAYNRLDEFGNPTNEQVIWVRVVSGAANNPCYVLVSFPIRVIPAPVLNPLGDPFGYVLCETGTTGQAQINTDDIAYNLYRVADSDPTNIITLLDEDPATNQGQSTDLLDYTLTYHWTSAEADSGVNAISSGTMVSDGDTLYVRVVYTSSGCLGEIGVIEITVEPRPGIAATSIEEYYCSDEQGGATVSLDLTQYDATVNPGAPADTRVVYYADQVAYENGEAIDVPSNYTTYDNPQTLIAEVINTNTLCESAAVVEITIHVNSRPVVDISMYDGMVICVDLNQNTPVEGGDYDPIILDTLLPEDGTYTFSWMLDGQPVGGNTASLAATQAGTYEVTVTHVASNCISSSMATLIQSNPPEFSVRPLSLAFDETHSAEVYNIQGAGDYEFRIDNGPWMSLGELTSIVFDGLSAGEHLVYGRDKNGCGVTIQMISFIDYPKFFTPNEDGYNDRWNIIGLQDQPQAKIYIFDRYGKLLKQLSPMSEGWDGTYNGKPMPSNDYWFSVEYLQTNADGTTSVKTFKKNFTLKR